MNLRFYLYICIFVHKNYNSYLDVTPDNESKGMEVADWLSQHGGQVSNYSIIDDENDMLPEQQTHFVQTNPQFGISKKNVEELLCYGRLKTSQDS